MPPGLPPSSGPSVSPALAPLDPPSAPPPPGLCRTSLSRFSHWAWARCSRKICSSLVMTSSASTYRAEGQIAGNTSPPSAGRHNYPSLFEGCPPTHTHTHTHTHTRMWEIHLMSLHFTDRQPWLRGERPDLPDLPEGKKGKEGGLSLTWPIVTPQKAASDSRCPVCSPRGRGKGMECPRMDAHRNPG